jgi:hypothetical protein
MGDGSPIRCRRKGQRLVVDSDGEQIEQSLEVLCQKMNDDRRAISVAPLQTSYKLVQETVADGHFRELCRTFGQLCDLLKKSLQKLLLTELHWIHEHCQTISDC